MPDIPNDVALTDLPKGASRSISNAGPKPGSSPPVVMYAHLFDDGQGQYLFIRNLGDGTQSFAQLVLNVKTKEVRVRKAPLKRLKSSTVPKDSDTEARIVSYLDANPKLSKFPPRYPRLHYYSHVPSNPHDPAEFKKWSRVSYWQFLNGGTLADFMETMQKSKIAVPLAIVARFIVQMLSTLVFLRTLPDPVAHGDVSSDNILVNWEPSSEFPDFYLADFGCSLQSQDATKFAACLQDMKAADVSALSVRGGVGESPSSCGPGMRTTAFDLYHFTEHALGLLTQQRCPANWVEAFQNSGPLRPVMEKLGKMSKAHEADVGSDANAKVDLQEVLIQARMMEVKLLAIEPQARYRYLFEEGIPNMGSLQPKYYKTREAILATTHVHGPWYVARVRVDTMAIIGIEGEPHHRPNAQNSSSDSDESSVPPAALGNGDAERVTENH